MLNLKKKYLTKSRILKFINKKSNKYLKLNKFKNIMLSKNNKSNLFNKNNLSAAK